MAENAAPTSPVARTFVMGGVALGSDMVQPAAISTHVLLIEILPRQHVVFRVVTVPGGRTGLSARQSECLISATIIAAQGAAMSPRQLSWFILLAHESGHPFLSIGGDQTSAYCCFLNPQGLRGTHEPCPPLTSEIFQCLNFLPQGSETTAFGGQPPVANHIAY